MTYTKLNKTTFAEILNNTPVRTNWKNESYNLRPITTLRSFAERHNLDIQNFELGLTRYDAKEARRKWTKFDRLVLFFDANDMLIGYRLNYTVVGRYGGFDAKVNHLVDESEYVLITDEINDANQANELRQLRRERFVGSFKDRSYTGYASKFGKNYLIQKYSDIINNVSKERVERLVSKLNTMIQNLEEVLWTKEHTYSEERRIQTYFNLKIKVIKTLTDKVTYGHQVQERRQLIAEVEAL